MRTTNSAPRRRKDRKRGKNPARRFEVERDERETCSIPAFAWLVGLD